METEAASPNRLVSQLADIDNPTVQMLIECQDIIQAYRTNKDFVINILCTPESVHEIISILINTDNFQIARRILLLFSSTNSKLLHFFAESVGYSEHLLQVLEIKPLPHTFVIGAVTQILLLAVDNFPIEMYEVLNSSLINYPRLIRNLGITSVSYFCTRFIQRDIHSHTFAWVVYCSLMDDHGPGCAIPKVSTYDPAASIQPVRLSPSLRRKAIELLFTFFSEFGDRVEFSHEFTDALPLILQDASDDQERALVFKIGLMTHLNKALGYSAQSILNCLKSSDILIQYALYYIHVFVILIKNSSLELLLYRLLHSKPNNFVLIAAAKAVQTLIEKSTRDSSDLSERLQMIIADAFKNGNPSSQILRAFRMCFLEASNGVDIDPQEDECVSALANLMEHPEICEVDEEYIAELKAHADIIDNDTDTFLPYYTTKKLWEAPDVYQAMSERFRTLNRLPHLDDAGDASSPRQDADHQIEMQESRDESWPVFTVQDDNRKSPARVKIAASFQPQLNLPEEEDEEYDYDYEYEEDEESIAEMEKIRALIERQKMRHEQPDAFKDQGVEPTRLPQQSLRLQRQLPAIPKPPEPISHPPEPTSQRVIPKVEKPISPPRKDNEKPRDSPNESSGVAKNDPKRQKEEEQPKKKKGGKKSAKPKKKGGKKKGKKDRPTLSLQTGLATVAVPPQHQQQAHVLELGVSTIRLRPRKPRAKINNRILIVDVPVDAPSSLALSPSNYFEVDRDEIFEASQAPPRPTPTREQIREMLLSVKSDNEEEDFVIEPLASEADNEESEDEMYVPNPFGIRLPKEDLGYSDEDEEEYNDSSNAESNTPQE